MYLQICIILTLALFVQCNQIDVLKISDVPFPNSGCCSINHFAAAASAPMESDIPEFTVCYRMLIDSYNDELFAPFAADMEGDGKRWNILDQLCWKCGRGSEGYQGDLMYLQILKVNVRVFNRRLFSTIVNQDRY